MLIKIHSNDAKVLMRDIISIIKGGELKTWKIVSDEKKTKFITHTSRQYYERVLLYLTPSKDNKTLDVETNYWEELEEPSESIIAIYIGMFTSTLLTHFNDDFSKLEVFYS